MFRLIWVSLCIVLGVSLKHSCGHCWSEVAEHSSFCGGRHALGLFVCLGAILGYACWLVDFVVCWRASLTGGSVLVSPSNFGCRSCSGGSRRDGSSHLRLPRSQFRLCFQLVLFWVLNCRIGEAAVPGPSVDVWKLGVCNPSGLMNKGHLLDPQVDCWVACETHLSNVSYRIFRSGLVADGSAFRWMVPGAHVPCRSTVSSIGAWSGVAMISQWPARSLPFDWSPAVQASGRILCSTSFIHDMWVTGITVYGTPTGPTHPHARATTNQLLSHAVNRIAQSHGPRFVAGDWNHDLCSLDAVDGLLALGFRDAQELHCLRTGVHPKPTCKRKTRRDFLFLSPELQSLFVGCEVDHEAWPDHSAVIASFSGGSAELVHYPWPIPASIPWTRLAGRGDGDFFDFGDVANCDDCYLNLWKNVEQCAVDFSASQGKPLSASCLGRGQRFKPLTIKAKAPPVPMGRRGDCQPDYFGANWTHSRLFRQVRRLESFVRLAKVEVVTQAHVEHKASLWRAIVNASGFAPSFSVWWAEGASSWGVVAMVPGYPPSLAVAVCIFESVRSFTRSYEKCLIKHRAYSRKLRKSSDMATVYATVRRDPPVPVDVLLHHREGVVSEVDEGDQAVEFREHVDWIEGPPLVHQGRQLTVHMATSDKVWLDSTAGIVPGHTIVQHSGVGRLKDIFDAFVSQWSARWCRHDLVPDSQWSSILEFAQGRFRPVTADPVVWTFPLLRSTIAGKKRTTSCGLDGITRSDLLSLRVPHLRSVLSMFVRAESDGSWPSQPLVGVVKSLAKVPLPGGTNDYRPITVLGLLYRVWSTVHARYWLKRLDSVIDPFLFGSRSGCRAAHVWRLMLDQVEWSQHTSDGVAGIILDLSKAFNTIPRFPTFAVAKMMGIHQSTLVGWAGALHGLQRRFMVRGSVSDPVPSSVGFPEGCALSCVGMLLVDQVFHVWMRVGNMMITPVSYVDNWELLLADPAVAPLAMQRALDFASQWDLKIDKSKTFSWGSNAYARMTLRQAGLPVCHDAKDLGTHLVYTRQLRNKTVLDRISSLDDFWTKLSSSRASRAHKVRAIRTAAWPRALHGVSAVIIGKKHWPLLRTCYMRSLKLLKPGANPYLQMALDGFGCDPQLYAIWTSLLDFRALGCSDGQLALLDQIGVQAVDAAQASVSQVLTHRVHQLGWSIAPGGFVRDRYGTFSLSDCCVGELQSRVSWAWLDFVATQVSAREDFPLFSQAYLSETCRGVAAFPLVDQAALRALMNGTTFTNRHAYHWSVDGSTRCPECGAVDSLYHKYWECAWTRDLVVQVPDDVRLLVPDLPVWARDRGWTVMPRLLELWRTYLLHLSPAVEFQWLDDVAGPYLDLFTDGSCIPGVNSDLSVASWAVCSGTTGCPGFSAESFRVVCSGPLHGLSQTAYRAELFAVYAALCCADRVGSSCRIWSDCAGVIEKFRLLTTGCKKLNSNSRHVDLWKLILGKVADIGLTKVSLSKVTAHISVSMVDNDVECWLARGNSAADAAAQAANRDRGGRIWELWKETSDSVVQSIHVGNSIRAHLVAVNRRWFLRTGEIDAPDVHVTRVAKSIPTKWKCQGPVGEVSGKVVRFFGRSFCDRLRAWWNELVDFSGVGNEWVSYAEIYLDWQLRERHAGVIKIQGEWFEFSDPAMAPEQQSFRTRVKYFRLLLQQWGRDAGVEFASRTGRSNSGFLQCHVGVASIPVKRDRLAFVEAWLRKHVEGPILGLGGDLDNIPPAW